MARPSKTAVIDYSLAHDLTNGLLERAVCSSDKPFVLVKDADKKGLRLRVTKAGGKHWQFETRIKGKLFTRALGEWPTVSIVDARAQAHELRGLTERGIDPREQERKQQAAQASHDAIMAKEAAAKALTVGDVWPLYLANGKPKRRDAWKPRYRADMEAMASPGGVPKKRGQGLTRPGPLYPLLAQRLAEVNEDVLLLWYEREAQVGKHQAARALMMFRGFLRWCSTRPEYRTVVDLAAGSAPGIVENLPAVAKRTDALDTAQIAGWWAGTEQLSNRTAAAYLRALLLTGARREEIATIRWEDVDFHWRKLTIPDKVASTRTIPLTPYFAQMLMALPRRGMYVFASASKSGRICDPRKAHSKVLEHAKVAHLTFHGLRRTYIRQGRNVAPAGVPAQIAGHAPSAVAEGYAILSMDELRPHADRIEAHILSIAGVQLDEKSST